MALWLLCLLAAARAARRCTGPGHSCGGTLGDGLSPCPAGKYQDQCCVGTQVRRCKACAAGTFAAVRGAAHCVWCPPGQYTLATDAERRRCRTCPSGRAVRDAWRSGPTAFHPALLACVFCSAGRFRDARTVSAVEGERRGGTSSKCALCAKGHFQPKAGAAACAECPAGKWTTASVDASGRPAPFDGLSCAGMCAGGHYVVTKLGLRQYGGSGTVLHVCEACDLGRHAPYPGASTCAPCPGGRYAAAPGAERCTACPHGRVSALWLSDTDFRFFPSSPEAGNQKGHGEEEGKRSEDDSEDGHGTLSSGGEGGERVRATAGGSTCVVPCAASAGMRAPVVVSLTSDGRPTCEACPAGRFKAPRAYARCAPCPRGKYRRTMSRTEAHCSSCPPGRSSSVAGAISPVGSDVRDCDEVCAPGRFASGGSLCRPCARGRAQPKAGQAACVQCVEGRFAHAAPKAVDRTAGSKVASTPHYTMEGATSCRACPAGAASTTGSVACLKCPRGRFASPPTGSFACVAPKNCVCADREHGVHLNLKKGGWCSLKPSTTLVAAPQIGAPTTAGAAAGGKPRPNMISRLPCLLADGSLVVAISPGLKAQGIDVANAFVAPQRHGALCAALAPIGSGPSTQQQQQRGQQRKQQQSPQRPACSVPKCIPSERFGAWSPCSRGCGGGWTKRYWHRVTCIDFHAPSTGYRCHACRPHAAVQEQSRRCNTKPCPCVLPLGGRPQARSWVSDAERREILRQMAELGIWLAGSRHCRESEQQLRLCRQDADSAARTAEPGLTAALCAALHARYRDCATAPGAPPCRVAHELPTWVWLPPLTAAAPSSSSSSSSSPSSSAAAPAAAAARTKPLTWRGFRGWEALKEIVDKVGALTTRLRVEALEAQPAAPALIAATEPPAPIGIGNGDDDS